MSHLGVFSFEQSIKAHINDYADYPMVVGKVVKGVSELWVELVSGDGGLNYYLAIVAKGSMTQDITASGLLNALNKDGRVALYINFDTGKATIRPDSKPIIDQIVQMMKSNADLELGVEGHTDNSSEEGRAKNRRVELVKKGAAP